MNPQDQSPETQELSQRYTELEGRALEALYQLQDFYAENKQHLQQLGYADDNGNQNLSLEVFR
jgi:hypothetical protein